MILTSEQIYNFIGKNQIIIEPFYKTNLGTVSYKFHIDNQILKISNDVDSKKECKPKNIIMNKVGYKLQPNNIYLCNTYEKMGSYIFAQKIFGIKKISSLGMYLDISANLGHSGCITKWTLELRVLHDLMIYPYQSIGQITFWVLDGIHEMYKGKYNNKSMPLISKLYTEL